MVAFGPQCCHPELLPAFDVAVADLTADAVASAGVTCRPACAVDQMTGRHRDCSARFAPCSASHSDSKAVVAASFGCVYPTAASFGPFSKNLTSSEI